MLLMARRNSDVLSTLPCGTPSYLGKGGDPTIYTDQMAMVELQYMYVIYHYGIRGGIHDWFQSYLSNRLQYTAINSTLSQNKPVNLGVP